MFDSAPVSDTENQQQNLSGSPQYQTVHGVAPGGSDLDSTDTQVRVIEPLSGVAQKAGAKPGRLYKWKESKNLTVISTEPPPADISASVLLFAREPDAVNRAAATASASIRYSEADPMSPSFSDHPVEVYTPGGLRELIRYSREVGEKIELRGEELNELIDLL